MPSAPPTADDFEACSRRIESWLADQLDGNPAVLAVETDEESGERRWFVRLQGEEKSVFTVWVHLRQRNLHVETYLMPAPEEREGELYEYLLRRSQHLDGMAFAIGEEDGIFVIGQTPLDRVDDEELDRLVGTLYDITERTFRPAMRIGFASKFPRG